MKKIAAAFLLFCNLLFAGDSIEWLNSYDTARKAAVQSNKKILLVVVSPTCPYCVQLLNGPMSDKEIASIVTSQYEPLMLMNIEELPKGIRATGVPTIYKLNANGKPQGAPLIGMQDTQILKAWLLK